MKEIAIVIPTKGRDRKLFPLLWNIVQTTPTGVFEVYFVVNEDDGASRRIVMGMAGPVHLVLTDEPGYPKAVNVGIRASNEPLIAIVNDDVKFHNGWWDGLRKVLTPKVKVVASNDLSPHTANGDACTQPIVRREYIVSPGGAYGEPGIAMHEGYVHNFSETELWELALYRGVAAFAPECVIEHVHPDWGKAELDDTYMEGSRRPGGWEHDHILYLQREALWQSR
jgi:glycosyltransferase involved in cell wall biosynthesis